MVYSYSMLTSKKMGILLAALIALSINAPAQAEKVLNGSISAQRVAKLTSEISWLESVDDAKKQAKKGKKLILWVNMLGKLEGDT